MANLNWLKTARVKVPNRSGYDKSFRNLLTAKVGTLVPLLCDEVIPGTKVNLNLALQAQLPPLASDTFMRCKVKTEAFFVPNRLLYGGYEAWLTGDQLYDQDSSQFVNVTIPVLFVDTSVTAQRQRLEAGSLADYLGYRFSASDVGAMNPAVKPSFNLFPFIAYHKIYDDWYRNTKVQQKIFSRPSTNDSPHSLSSLPYIFETSGLNLTLYDQFLDGVRLGDLRQRNFGSDYFTECTPLAQQGAAQKVHVDANDDFTVSALRAANSIQQWLERNNLAGFRLQDYVRANYGANLSDGVAQRTLYLGSQDFDVYSKGIEANADLNAGYQNPFSSVGARYGNAYATGNGSLISGFEANEPGYIFVMASLVPHVAYASGILRQNLRYAAQNTQSDLATPLLQNVGNQPVYLSEVSGLNEFTTAGHGKVFGYIDRYADFMTREDEVHGLLRDGYSLQAFAAQRYLTGSNISINSAFLQIPTTYLDQVTAVSSELSTYGVWIDSFLDYKISQPLAQFCQPSLQDPAYEHGHEVSVRRSGSRL